MAVYPSPLTPTDRRDMLEYQSNQDETHIRPVAAIELDLDFHLTDNEVVASVATRTNDAERLVDKIRDERRRMSTSMLANNHAVPSDDDDDDDDERKLREKLELELASKEHEITALVVDRHQLQSTLIKVDDDDDDERGDEAVRYSSPVQIADLENVLTEKEKLIAQLESKLQIQADYDDIKKELT